MEKQLITYKKCSLKNKMQLDIENIVMINNHLQINQMSALNNP